MHFLTMTMLLLGSTVAIAGITEPQVDPNADDWGQECGQNNWCELWNTQRSMDCFIYWNEMDTRTDTICDRAPTFNNSACFTSSTDGCRYPLGDDTCNFRCWAEQPPYQPPGWATNFGYSLAYWSERLGQWFW